MGIGTAYLKQRKVGMQDGDSRLDHEGPCCTLWICSYRGKAFGVKFMPQRLALQERTREIEPTSLGLLSWGGDGIAALQG